MALALFVDVLVAVTVVPMDNSKKKTVVPMQELDLSANATTDIDCHV